MLLTAKQQAEQASFIGPPAPVRRYYQVSIALQDAITTDELTELKAIGVSGQAIAFFKRVVIDKNTDVLTANQVAIVTDIHARAQTKHTCPDFCGKDSFTLQLNLDARMLPTLKPKPVSEALQLRAGESYLLCDDDNKQYRRFIDIAGVEAHGKRIRIPVILTRAINRRLQNTANDYAALTIELTSHKSQALEVGMRLICGKPPIAAAIDLSRVTAIVGRDFGYTNTICLSVALSSTPIDLTTSTSAIRADSKEAAKVFFETHTLPDDVTFVERIKFSGKKFLARIDSQCQRIDSYKSKIDLHYNDLEVIRGQLFAQLGLVDGDQITPAHKQSVAGQLVKDFFQLKGLIDDLKKARRKLYASIAALKKHWFGFLSNQEMGLAKRYQAVIVRIH